MINLKRISTCVMMFTCMGLIRGAEYWQKTYTENISKAYTNLENTLKKYKLYDDGDGIRRFEIELDAIFCIKILKAINEKDNYDEEIVEARTSLSQGLQKEGGYGGRSRKERKRQITKNTNERLIQLKTVLGPTVKEKAGYRYFNKANIEIEELAKKIIAKKGEEFVVKILKENKAQVIGQFSRKRKLDDQHEIKGKKQKIVHIPHTDKETFGEVPTIQVSSGTPLQYMYDGKIWQEFNSMQYHYTVLEGKKKNTRKIVIGETMDGIWNSMIEDNAFGNSAEFLPYLYTCESLPGQD
ncbi:MAG TPA: hypothetical protein VEK38_02755 [Candidatus Bathyarchaeia archaeon]|nr:hypothetical protein [Candidatus Bathyarchaeia archaeon]